ncbi:30S ribosomal protein S16 [Patescibacteria group bacterium]|nr:30S ribosomal protein S16 [Patescibacteria group bacterium]
MLTIRLSRIGKRHQPRYRVVVMEKQKDPWAPAIEILGLYNPLTEPRTIELKEDRIKHWLDQGAQPSATVHNLLVDAGMIKAEKIDVVHISKKRKERMAEKENEVKKEVAEKAKEVKEVKEEAPAEEEKPVEEAPAEEAKEEENKE